MARRRIIDASMAVGPVDMNYDYELANWEALVRHGEDWMYRLTLPSPLEIEKATDRFLEECLASVK